MGYTITVFISSDDLEHVIKSSRPLGIDIICKWFNIKESEIVGIDIQRGKNNGF